jgi:hypothetical protein
MRVGAGEIEEVLVSDMSKVYGIQYKMGQTGLFANTNFISTLFLIVPFKNLHDSVIDSAAVGIPDELIGSNIYVFLVAKAKCDSDEETLINELKVLVEKRVAKFGLPTFFLVRRRLCVGR